MNNHKKVSTVSIVIVALIMFGVVLASSGVLRPLITAFENNVATTAPARDKSKDLKATAEELLEAGKPGEAIARLRELIEENNADNFWAHSTLAGIYVSQGSFENAERSYLKALEIEPGNSNLYNQLGALYLKKGDPMKALNSYKNAIKKDPSNVAANYMLGEITLASGQPQIAVGLYRKVVALDPNYKDAKTKLAAAVKQEQALQAKQAADKREEAKINKPTVAVRSNGNSTVR